MKVCMLIYGRRTQGLQLWKEALTLARAGHDVRIVANLPHDAPLYEDRDGLRVIRTNTNQIHHRLFRLLPRPLSDRLRASLAPRIIQASGRDAQHLTLVDLAKPRLISNFVKRVLRDNRTYYLTAGWLLAAAYVIFYLPLAFVLRLFPVDLFQYICYSCRSVRAVLSEPAQVYHAGDVSTLTVGWLARRLTGGKLVYDYDPIWQDRSRPDNPFTFNRLFLARVEPFLIRRADARIAGCESAAGQLKRLYRAGMPTVISSAAGQPVTDRAGDLRDELGIPAEEKIIVYFGVFAPHSGLEELIQSSQYLDHSRLVLMGWGSNVYVTVLQQLVSRKKLTHKVDFFNPAPVEKAVQYLPSADLGVFPAGNTCLGHGYCAPAEVFEYIAAGLPVAGSNLPDFKKVIEERGLGVTFDSEYPRDIANAISYILDDENRYQEMTRNVLEAAKTFNWKYESEKLLNLYQTLADSSDS